MAFRGFLICQLPDQVYANRLRIRAQFGGLMRMNFASDPLANSIDAPSSKINSLPMFGVTDSWGGTGSEKEQKRTTKPILVLTGYLSNPRNSIYEFPDKVHR